MVRDGLEDTVRTGEYEMLRGKMVSVNNELLGRVVDFCMNPVFHVGVD